MPSEVSEATSDRSAPVAATSNLDSYRTESPSTTPDRFGGAAGRDSYVVSAGFASAADLLGSTDSARATPEAELARFRVEKPTDDTYGRKPGRPGDFPTMRPDLPHSFGENPSTAPAYAGTSFDESRAERRPDPPGIKPFARLAGPEDVKDVTTETAPDGSTRVTRFDSGGRATSIAITGTDASGGRFSHNTTYGADGAISTESISRSDSSGRPALDYSREGDRENRTDYKDGIPTTSSASSFKENRSPDGTLLGSTWTSDVQRYGPDGAALPERDSTAFHYDRSGRPWSMDHSILNQRDQVMRRDNVVYPNAEYPDGRTSSTTFGADGRKTSEYKVTPGDRGDTTIYTEWRPDGSVMTVGDDHRRSFSAHTQNGVTSRIDFDRKSGITTRSIKENGTELMSTKSQGT